MALRPPPAVRQDGRSGAFGPLRSRSAHRRSATFGSFRNRSLASGARETSAPSGDLRGRMRPASPRSPRPASLRAQPGTSRDPRARETSALSGDRGRAGVRETSDGLGGGARGSSEPLGTPRSSSGAERPQLRALSARPGETSAALGCEGAALGCEGGGRAPAAPTPLRAQGLFPRPQNSPPAPLVAPWPPAASQAPGAAGRGGPS